MVNPTVPEYLALIYLVISLYTSVAQPMIAKALGSERNKLKYWAKSLQLNARLVPLTGLSVIIIGMYDYFKLGNSYFLYGSLVMISTPFIMTMIGKIPQGNKRLVRIDRKYEPDETLSVEDEKEVVAGIQKWTLFHRFRCVLALASFVLFLIASSQVQNQLLVPKV